MTDLTIILAEDDDGHAALIQRNLERARVAARIVRVARGTEVLDMLIGESPDVPPGSGILVLLDIRMPGMDGTEVLRILKTTAITRKVPVYMLTTTDDPREVERCFTLGCNAYLTKPVDYGALVQTIHRLCAFLEVTQIPGPEAIRHVPF
jgi:CheY-like chemotaxis protein